MHPNRTANIKRQKRNEIHRTATIFTYAHLPAPLENLNTLVERVQSFELVGSADSPQGMLAGVLATDPDVVLVSSDYGRTQTMQATRDLIIAQPRTAVIVVCGPEDVVSISAAVAVGATAVLSWGCTPAEIEAIVGALDRAEYKPTVRGQLPVQRLTLREREVLEAISNGLSNREIGRQLFLAPNTIGVFVAQLFRKLGAHNRAQAVAMAIRMNIIN